MPTPTAETARDGSVSWKVRFREGGRGSKATSRTFAEEKAAARFARLVEQLGATEASRILDDQISRAATTDHTVESWLRHHVDHLTGVTDGTRDRYRRQIVTRFGTLGHLQIEAIGHETVACWVNALEKQGLSGKTISNYHGFLSAAMKGAVRSGLIESNPCDGTRLPRTEREEMVFLTGEEFAHLMAHVPARGRDMVAVLPMTGLRFGEITALQVRDLDLRRGLLTVNRAWKYVEGSAAGELGAPKSRRSRRTIALPRQAVEVLHRAIIGKGPEDLVFTNSVGRAWTSPRFHPGVWQPAVRAAMSEQLHDPEADDGCAFPRLTKRPRVHDMRHTCASWMLHGGARIDIVQRHLGHESIQTTIDRYHHLEPSALATAAAVLGDAVAVAIPLQIEP